MGIFDLFKKSREAVNRENQYQGKEGEKKIKRDWEFAGYRVTRTGRGHDLKAQRRDPLTGEKETKFIEVKTGNSRLSNLQRKKQRQYGERYVVESLDPTPFGLTYSRKPPNRYSKKHNSKESSKFNVLLGSRSNTRKRRSKKKSSVIDTLFGTSEPSESRRKNSSRYDTLSGPNKTTSRRRRKASKYDDLIGSNRTKSSGRKSSRYSSLIG